MRRSLKEYAMRGVEIGVEEKMDTHPEWIGNPLIRRPFDLDELVESWDRDIEWRYVR